MVKINKPISEVFAFTLNPLNTSRWVDSIVKEEVNERPTKLGTIYRNVDKGGKWSTYTISSFEVNKLFVFTSEDKNYHCRYTLTSIDENTTELEYYEWMDKGELEGPFTLDILEKLKTILED